MFDSQADWVEENEHKELPSISRILKHTFGESFEEASIHQKLRLLEASCQSMRMDKEWVAACGIEGCDTRFPFFFEDTQEAMKLIKNLAEAIASDMAFHNLPIGGEVFASDSL